MTVTINYVNKAKNIYSPNYLIFFNDKFNADMLNEFFIKKEIEEIKKILKKKKN